MIRTEFQAPRQFSDVSKLIDYPIVIKVNNFDHESAHKFGESFALADQHSQPVIPIVIDSYGGQVYSLYYMLDLIRQASKPVATIALGKAMSCGAALLGFGTPGYRYASPNSTIMIHEVSSGMRGKVEDLKSDVAESNRLNQSIYRQLARHCGHHEMHFMDQIYDRRNADWYLNAEEALEQKLVDYIRIPKFKVNVNVNVEFA